MTEEQPILRMKENGFGALVFSDAMKFAIRREISAAIAGSSTSAAIADLTPEEALRVYVRIETIRANAERLIEVHRNAIATHPEGHKYENKPDFRNFGSNTPSAPYPHGSQL